jgi:hypothetical protein
MTKKTLGLTLCAAAAALALVGAGCGGGNSSSPEPSTTTSVESSQAYLDQVTAIVRGTDSARGDFRGATPGESTVLAARQLVRASEAAAADLDELTPPANFNGLNQGLARKFRRLAAALDKELARNPVSMSRLGDVVREYGKASDDVYEQILITP